MSDQPLPPNRSVVSPVTVAFADAVSRFRDTLPSSIKPSSLAGRVSIDIHFAGQAPTHGFAANIGIQAPDETLVHYTPVADSITAANMLRSIGADLQHAAGKSMALNDIATQARFYAEQLVCLAGQAASAEGLVPVQPDFFGQVSGTAATSNH